MSDKVRWKDDTEEMVIEVGAGRDSVLYDTQGFYDKHYPNAEIERYTIGGDEVTYTKASGFEVDFFNRDEILEVVVITSNYDEWRYTGVVELYEQDDRLVIKTVNYNHIYEKLVSSNLYINKEFIIAYNVVEKE